MDELDRLINEMKLSQLTDALVNDAKEEYLELVSEASERLKAEDCDIKVVLLALLKTHSRLNDRLAEIKRSLTRDLEKAFGNPDADSTAAKIKEIVTTSSSKEEAMHRLRTELGGTVTEISIDEGPPDGEIVH